MKTIRKNDMGVSPVIAVILMVAITVVLAGVVFLWAQSFTEDAGGGADTISVDLELTQTAAAPGVATLYVTPLKGDLDWTEYELIFNGVGATEPTTTTQTGLAEAVVVTGLTALTVGDEYNVKMVKIEDQSVVLDTDVVCKAA